MSRRVGGGGGGVRNRNLGRGTPPKGMGCNSCCGERRTKPGLTLDFHFCLLIVIFHPWTGICQLEGDRLIDIGSVQVSGDAPTLPWVRSRVWIGVGLGRGGWIRPQEPVLTSSGVSN